MQPNWTRLHHHRRTYRREHARFRPVAFAIRLVTPSLDVLIVLEPLMWVVLVLRPIP